MTAESSTIEDQPNLEDALRRVYGDAAIISHVGDYQLVHLDSPTPALIAERTAAFVPPPFVDDCPMCQLERSQGGHYVFDGSTGADGASADSESSSSFWDRVPAGPLTELLQRLDAFDAATDALVCALEPVASADLLKRVFEDVGSLHFQVGRLMFPVESPDRIEALERLFAKTSATLAEVSRSHDDLAPLIGQVTGPLETVVGICRGL